MLSIKIILWYVLLHNSHMWDCAPSYWPNLMKGRGMKELEQLKSLMSLKIQEVTSKRNVAVTEKNENNMLG